jgi:hypothetical protein
MPTVNLTAELSLEDLLLVVSNLDDDELAEFEIQFEQLWLSRFVPVDQDAARVAADQRLSPQQQIRLRALLEKNREAGLTDTEEKELDNFIANIDQSLSKTADELLNLAEQRKTYSSDDPQ